MADDEVGFDVEDVQDVRYTLEEYTQMLQADQWQLDNCQSYTEYSSKWTQKIKDWHSQSEKNSEDVRKTWDICYKAFNSSTIKSVSASPTVEDNIAAARIPIMKNECLDEISALYANDFIPTVSALMPQAKQMAALANIYVSNEFKMNDWRSKKFTLGLDAYCTDMWVVRTGTRDDAPGIFGQKERIIIDRVDPRNYFPDLEAKSLAWVDQDYIIVTDEVDVGVARSMFKEKASLIDLALAEPTKKKHKYGGFTTLPGQRSGSSEVTERERIKLKECWVHDERYKFVATTYEDVADGGKSKVEVDDEGYVVGTWEKAYPHGRMIVTAADKVILQDIPNPYWSHEAPFTACRMSPEVGGALLGVGKAADILGIERKVNDVESRVHSYAQSEIERPMHADTGALTNNSSWYKTSGQSRAILLMNGGKTFTRPVAVDTPAFLPGYLARLDTYTSKISGKPPILAGQISEGAELSNQAVQGTQAFGASRYGMQSIFIASATKKVGRQVFELIRETYPAEGNKLTAEVMTPNGDLREIEWDQDSVGDAYFMDIDLASGTPGGKAASNNALMGLFEKGLVDDVYTLQGMGVDGWQDIIKRKHDKKDDQIYTQAAGRAAGLQIKEITKQNERPGKAASA